MANKSIEERAKKHALESCYGNQNDLMYQSIYECTLAALTEQDHISRQEERERCVKVVDKFLCSRCAITNKNVCKTCESRTLLRKAMEGDNNGN